MALTFLSVAVGKQFFFLAKSLRQESQLAHSGSLELEIACPAKFSLAMGNLASVDVEPQGLNTAARRV